MRLLYVTNGFPYPLTSGYLRHYYLIRELSQRHSITLLSLVSNDISPEHMEELTPYTDRILLFRRANPGNNAFRKAIGSSRTFSGWSSGIRQLWQAVETATSTNRFDVAFFSGKFTLPVHQRLRGVPAVADICDAGSVRLRDRMSIAGLVHIPTLLIKYFFMRRLEQRVRRRASHAVFASCRDRDALTHPGDPDASVVPNGVDLEYWKRRSTHSDRNKIVFTGAMNYGPNVDAALYLMHSIFPRVLRAVPEATLQIVGRDPVAQLLANAKGQPGITITGYVDDMRPHMERASVFVAPLRFAAGIQNKLLEAMAMEMHTVATPAAAGGVRTEDGQSPPIDVAEDPTTFAISIIRQLRRPDGSTVNPLTREYVEQHFNWRQGAEKLECVLERVAGRKLGSAFSRREQAGVLPSNVASG